MKRLGYAAGIAFGFGFAVALLVFSFGRSDEPSFGYRLRAETMIPTEGPVYTDTIACPNGLASSPIAYSPTGSLAEELTVYEGEVIATRIALSPFVDRLPERVEFEASWPTAVTAAEPLCAFVVSGDPAVSTSLSWKPIEGGASFTIEPEPFGVSVVEVWLVAADPEPGTTFSTRLTTPLTGDDIVVDPLGGPVSIDERRGGIPVLMLESPAENVENGEFEIIASVTNPSATARVIEGVLTIEATEDVIWSPPTDRCSGGVTLVCPVGDIDAGGAVEITVTGRVPENWSPRPVSCQTSVSSGGVGVCISARVVSEDVVAADEPIENLLLDAVAADPGMLGLRPEADPVVVRSAAESDIPLLLSTASQGVAAVDVIDSDCLSIERVESSSDNGDTSLAPGEDWRYICKVSLLESTNIRIVVAALNGGLEAIATSIDVPVIVVNPALAVTAVTNESGNSVVTVANVGLGDLFGLAVALPGCETIRLLSGVPKLVVEGGEVQFSCTSGDVEVDGIAAYATDAAGLNVRGATE